MQHLLILNPYFYVHHFRSQMLYPPKKVRPKPEQTACKPTPAPGAHGQAGSRTNWKPAASTPTKSPNKQRNLHRAPEYQTYASIR